MSDSSDTKTRIVVADDHPVMRMGLAALIESDPSMVVVAEAADGRQAVELCRRLVPDVLLIDLRMPGMDGVAATAAVHAELPAIGILVVTTYDGDEDIYRALEGGARGYLLKNVPGDDVLAAIRAVADGRRWIPPDVGGRLAERLARQSCSPRELDVLRLIVKGKSNKEIAVALGISEQTTKTHVRSILQKLEVADRTEAATAALLRGIIH